ncbi:MAG: diacylglycerol kinase [SAR324 cluster bacterium]|nr:diacylglycerol kinase [SAR324 cluster bacterium]
MNEPPEIPPIATGLTRVFKATIYSYKGFKSALQSEAALRQEMTLSFIFALTLPYLDLTHLEKLFLLATLAIVIITELLNSAIEAIVDLVSPGYHELAGKAKDIGSAAVFTSLSLAGVCWVWGWVKGFHLLL